MNRKKILKLLAGLTIVLSSSTIINLKGMLVMADDTHSENVDWKFNNSDDGWKYGGEYDYTGSKEVSYDKLTNALELNLDYRNNALSSWSEFKISKALDSPIKFDGYNILTYDFIYNPQNMTTGSFKSKLFINGAADSYSDINLENSEDAGNGLKKAKVTIKFDSKSVNIDSIIISIIGNNTDYNGKIYIDNIKFNKENRNVYVEKTNEPKSQNSIDVSKLDTKEGVKLVDENAIKEVGSLYSYLIGVGKSDKVLYGHQNDTHHKAILKDSGTNSDTKDVTGSIAAISGIDSLSLTGAELQLSDEEKEKGLDLITKAAELGIDASKEGGIIAMSCHMPNFAEVAKKGKIDGKYDYSGYTPNVTTGDVVSRIMPGGDLNEAYTGYLDMVAEYAKKLENAGVPVLFRPFHENNGSWFWWGKAFCDSEAYKNLYRYTVEYLRDTKEVHNFLYVYSPNGPFEDEDDYLLRYPGDEFIDVLAFDFYENTTPLSDSKEDPWMTSFKDTIKLVQGIADKKEKLSAVSETGIISDTGAAILTGNPNKNWFQDISDIVSESNMPYYMVWANFDTKNFFAPFMANDTEGHEMINEFIDYYNDEKSIFANQTGNYTKVNTKITDSYSYGFITSPASRNRMLKPVKITASVKGYTNDIKFIIKNKNGDIIETIKANLDNNIYSGYIDQNILDKIGKTIGTIDLYSGNIKLNSITALFNIKEPDKDPKVVDDFESYIGEQDLLDAVWATNSGDGCYVKPQLKTENYSNGEYGLEFNYKISTEKISEGWAGITRTVGADWTDCDALRLWCKPDGYGQKLVIQITSNGEDFEVFLPEFAATTEAKVLTIPFSEFKGKNGGTLDLANIEKMGIWCNTIKPQGSTGTWTVESKMYFDNIKAVNTNAETKVGWNQNSDGNWYYLNEDGSMKKGWFKDTNGRWYYLKENGEMAINEVINGYKVNNNGEWVN